MIGLEEKRPRAEKSFLPLRPVSEIGQRVKNTNRKERREELKRVKLKMQVIPPVPQGWNLADFWTVDTSRPLGDHPWKQQWASWFYKALNPEEVEFLTLKHNCKKGRIKQNSLTGSLLFLPTHARLSYRSEGDLEDFEACAQCSFL